MVADEPHGSWAKSGSPKFSIGRPRSQRYWRAIRALAISSICLPRRDGVLDRSRRAEQASQGGIVTALVAILARTRKNLAVRGRRAGSGRASRSMNRVGLRLLSIWIGVGFLANYAWEMLHMQLYAGMTGGWKRCAAAAATDVAVLAFLYAVMAAAAGSWAWCHQATLPRSLALVAIGSMAAVAIELRALAEGRWSYGASMPLVPLFHVGWSPVLQMVIIPIGLAWMSRLAMRTA